MRKGNSFKKFPQNLTHAFCAFYSLIKKKKKKKKKVSSVFYKNDHRR
jgi:hypothetical protein